jgi:hypothetical protein
VLCILEQQECSVFQNMEWSKGSGPKVEKRFPNSHPRRPCLAAGSGQIRPDSGRRHTRRTHLADEFMLHRESRAAVTASWNSWRWRPRVEEWEAWLFTIDLIVWTVAECLHLGRAKSLTSRSRW